MFDFLFILVFLCRRGIKQFDVHFSRIILVLFPSKDGKDSDYERINGCEGVCFPPELASFVFMIIMIKVLFPI